MVAHWRVTKQHIYEYALKRRVIVSTIIVIVLVSTLIWWSSTHRTFEGFPLLPEGQYVGAISDLGQQKDQTTLMYVEVLPGQQEMVFAVMQRGWKPQLLPLEKDPVAKEGNSNVLKPVQLRYAGEILRLYGEGSEGFYTGHILSEDEKEGRWELKPLSSDAFITTAKQGLGEDFDLNRWSYLKAQQRILSREIESDEEQTKDARGKYEQLVKYLNDSETLKLRAIERRDELTKEVEAAKKDYESAISSVGKEYSALEVLGRITRRGKAVELARRVASREDRWYLANWQEGESMTGMEEFLGDSFQVDLGRLDADYRKAREVNLLVEEVNTERERVRQLEQMVVEQQQAPTQQDKYEEQPRKRRSFWDRLF